MILLLLNLSREDYGQMLGFEPVCLVPFEPKLIDYDLLSEAHIDWLNGYNALTKERVGRELERLGKKQ